MDKTIEQLEEERLKRNIERGGKNQKAQANTQPVRTTPAPAPARVDPPSQQPTSPKWKYQQKQQQQPSAVLTGPAMDLSTRVNYLNSLYEQGSINDEEYQKRAEVLQIVGKIAEAVQKGDDASLQTLLNENPQLDLNQVQENEATIVHIAVDALCKGSSSARVLELICSRGANADTARKGITPLLNLCQYVNNVKDPESCIRTLLKYGASLKTGVRASNASSDTRTCLDLAVTNNAPVEVVQLLCNSRADPNVNTDQGPLINWCSIYGKVEESRILLEAGANPNSRVPEVGANCLATAIHDNNVELVRLLLKHGADKNAPVITGQKENSLQLAQALKLTEMQKILS